MMIFRIRLLLYRSSALRYAALIPLHVELASLRLNVQAWCLRA